MKKRYNFALTLIFIKPKLENAYNPKSKLEKLNADRALYKLSFCPHWPHPQAHMTSQCQNAAK